jgi:hypothetical protein
MESSENKSINTKKGLQNTEKQFLLQEKTWGKKISENQPGYPV